MTKVIFLILTLLAGPAFAGSMALLGAGKASGGGGPVNIFTPSTSPLNSDDTNVSTSFRMRLVVSAASLGNLRASFQASSTTGLATGHASICKWDGTAAPSCTAPPLQLLFSGASGFSIGAGASITSDFVNHSASFSIAPGDSVIVIFDVTTPGGQRFRTGQTNATLFFLGAVTTWNQANPAGFGTGTAGTDYVVASVDTQ